MDSFTSKNTYTTNNSYIVNSILIKIQKEINQKKLNLEINKIDEKNYSKIKNMVNYFKNKLDSDKLELKDYCYNYELEYKIKLEKKIIILNKLEKLKKNIKFFKLVYLKKNDIIDKLFLKKEANNDKILKKNFLVNLNIKNLITEKFEINKKFNILKEKISFLKNKNNDYIYNIKILEGKIKTINNNLHININFKNNISDKLFNNTKLNKIKENNIFYKNKLQEIKILIKNKKINIEKIILQKHSYYGLLKNNKHSIMYFDDIKSKLNFLYTTNVNFIDNNKIDSLKDYINNINIDINNKIEIKKLEEIKLNKHFKLKEKLLKILENRNFGDTYNKIDINWLNYKLIKIN